MWFRARVYRPIVIFFVCQAFILRLLAGAITKHPDVPGPFCVAHRTVTANAQQAAHSTGSSVQGNGKNTMSLRGRQVIDRLKNRVSGWFKLPCPPYGNTEYWEGLYNKLGPSDVYEWGSLTLEHDLFRYNYKLLERSGASDPAILTSSFGEAIGVAPSEAEKSIILLGCGNSKLGEDMAEHGWNGPLFQVDVVSRVLDTMSDRCSDLVEQGVMDFVQDDATELSAFDKNSIDAVIDKGLVDPLFCADCYSQVEDVLKSVHRVLRPGGIFCLLSFSQPQHLLPRLSVGDCDETCDWKDVQIRQLESILMYRFQKNEDATKRRRGPTKESLQRKRNPNRQRRR